MAIKKRLIPPPPPGPKGMEKLSERGARFFEDGSMIPPQTRSPKVKRPNWPQRSGSDAAPPARQFPPGLDYQKPAVPLKKKLKARPLRPYRGRPPMQRAYPRFPGSA